MDDVVVVDNVDKSVDGVVDTSLFCNELGKICDKILSNIPFPVVL